MTEWLEPEEQREQQLRQAYGWLYDRLLEILFMYDPAQLAAHGAPQDEYSVEVDMFLPRLKEIQLPDILSQMLYDVFVHMFGEEMMLTYRATFAPLAENVWKVYQHWQAEQI